MIRRLLGVGALAALVVVSTVAMPAPPIGAESNKLFRVFGQNGPETVRTAEGCRTFVRVRVIEIGYSEIYQMEARFQLVAPNAVTLGPLGGYQDSGWLASRAFGDDGNSHSWYFWAYFGYPAGGRWTIKLDVKGLTAGIRKDVGGGFNLGNEQVDYSWEKIGCDPAEEPSIAPLPPADGQAADCSRPRTPSSVASPF